MKFTLAFAALLSVNAITIKFTDDLMKDLAADMEKDTSTESLAQEEPAAAAPAPAKVEKKTEAKAAKTDAKKDASAKGKKTEAKAAPVEEKAEKQEDDIPFDASAMKAYSSVIADAAEDSEPSEAVVYTKTMPDEDAHASSHQPLDFDPMGSMIANEISEIKDASIKAAKDKE